MRKILSLLTTLVFVAMFGGNATALTSNIQATNTTSNPCLRYKNHEYEVCTAYIANSSLAVLWPYYEFSRSTNQSISGYVSYRLDSRYTGQANALIRSLTSNWPSGNMDVSAPEISILGVSSDLAANTATLTTMESWKVTTEDGSILYQETNALHTITMHRVPSYLLHKWVVSAIN